MPRAIDVLKKMWEYEPAIDLLNRPLTSSFSNSDSIIYSNHSKSQIEGSASVFTREAIQSVHKPPSCRQSMEQVDGEGCGMHPVNFLRKIGHWLRAS